MSRPITVGHGTFKVTATPARCIEVIRAVEALKTPTVKQARAAALRPAEKRNYPKFKDGMSTAEYVAAYHKTNAMRNLITEGFFQPLSTNPQFTQVGDCIEESMQ